MKVLVVEDSERLLHSLGHGLTKAGYAVDLATDGKTGLAFASALWRSILPAGASVAKASPFPSRRVSTRCSSFLRIGAGECSPAISYSGVSTEATGMYRTTPSRFSSPA